MPSGSASAQSVGDEPWRNRIPGEGQGAGIVYPPPETARLANGLSLYVVRRPAGVVSLSVVVRAGSGDLPAGQSGLAALTTRMLTEGTRKKSSRQLAEAAEALGTELDTSTGRDQALVNLTVLRSDLETGLRLLAEVVETPAFLSTEFDRVRKEWQDHLVQERQNPERLASLGGLRLLLGEALGAPVSGSLPDVGRLRVEDLVRLHQRVFAPDLAAVVVVGDAGIPDVEPLCRELFGDWRSRRPRSDPRPLGASHRERRVVIVDRPDAVQSVLWVALPWPERAAAGHEVRELLATVLGGMFTSRLNLNLREEHAYTYGVGARAIATLRWGALVISTSVKTEHTAAALEQIVLELKAAHDPSRGRPFTLEETERAKATLVASLGESLQAVDSVAGDTATLFSERLPADYYARYGQTIRAITRDALAAEARERLDPDHLTVVVVGARSQIEPSLRKLFPNLEEAKGNLLE
jgi:zinc protease